MEMLLTVKLWILGGTLGLLLLGFLYQHVGGLRYARRFPPPGRLVDVDGHRLHLIGSGQGSPSVPRRKRGGSSSDLGTRGLRRLNDRTLTIESEGCLSGAANYSSEGFSRHPHGEKTRLSSECPR